MKCEKSGNHTISYQSLLLSTTVLNDNTCCVDVTQLSGFMYVYVNASSKNRDLYTLLKLEFFATVSLHII